MRTLLLVIAVAFSACARAAEEPAALHFRLTVEAPGELGKTLRSNLDLARWQDYENLTPELLDSLVSEARTQAAEIAATEGYFSAVVDAKTEGEGRERVVRISVQPGEPVRVREVAITFMEEPEAEAAVRVREQWALPTGEIFRQGAWEAAKKHALESLAQTKYAAASIVRSQATVDPEGRVVSLEIELDHGPAFAFGPINIRGLSKYSRETVLNLAPFRAGDPYNREKVDVYVRRLTATGYFASAQVAVDNDPARAAAAPVQVSVIEAPTRRLEAGIGYSTDTRYRSSLSWHDVNLFDTGWRLRGEVRLESQLQGLSGGLDLPARSDGWADALDASATRTTVQNLTTRGLTVNATRRALDERRQPSYGLSYYFEHQAPSDAAPDTARALFARYEYVRRSTDDLLFPRSGAVAALRLGVGLPGVSEQKFGRVVGQLAWFYPITRRDDLALRAEAGAVLAHDSEGIPQALLFRTGGDTTVRGYAYQALGVTKGSAIVGGRYYALASAEYIHWFGTAWGAALFVDAGNAVDSPHDMHFAVGYGAGLRVRSPVGPFRLDFARGRDTGELRVHFSVGIGF